MRNYLLGTHNDVVLILDWVEARGKEVITEAPLKEMQEATMIELDSLQVARELWSWLNLTREHSSSVQRTFHHVQDLNGAEVYRRLVTPLGVTTCSVTRRSRLSDRVQQLVRAKNMLTLLHVVADWEARKLAFAKAGGKEHSDEAELDRREHAFTAVLASTTADGANDANGATHTAIHTDYVYIYIL